jgi:hypothetical protein
VRNSAAIASAGANAASRTFAKAASGLVGPSIAARVISSPATNGGCGSTAPVWGGPVDVGSCHLAQIPPADLHIPILGQPAPTQLLLDEGLEQGALEW